MSDLESRFDDALRADLPPERDALFRIDVLIRREHVRFRRRLAQTLAVALVAAVLAAMNAQAIGAWINSDVRRLWIFAAITATVMIALPGVPIRTTPGVRNLVQIFRRWFYT